MHRGDLQTKADKSPLVEELRYRRPLLELWRRGISGMLFCISSGVASGAAGGALSDALNTPDWLTLAGEHRTRFESLHGQFRASGSGSDQILVYRTALTAVARANRFAVAGEIMDSRQSLADAGTPLSASIVNTRELIQAYVSAEAKDTAMAGDHLAAQLGRFTLDVGDRRLVARNRYRNTLNTFDGIAVNWENHAGDSLQGFYLLPVKRLPGDRPSLLENRQATDKTSAEFVLAGLYFKSAEVLPETSGDLFVFYLDEGDDGANATQNRDIFTAGFRLDKRPSPGNLDFELESVVQFGTSRASAEVTESRDLDHRALFQHLQAGYSFGGRWSPRVIVQFDYASGDKSPTDGENNRFDTLFGARRFDFGPTGIYGPFARSNLISPGYRLLASPSANTRLMLSHRSYRLASATDGWVGTGLRDPSEEAGDNLGQQLEVQIKWLAVPDAIDIDIDIEFGVAKWISGTFSDRVPESGGESGSLYGYIQGVFRF